MAIVSFKDISSELIKEKPDEGLELVVTIPCFKEENIILSLKSLFQASNNQCNVEVIILINEPENPTNETSNLNKASYETCIDFKSKYETDKFKIHPVHVKSIPKKTAGVGLARKIAMDEAVSRLIQVQRFDGIITGFDADTLCEQDYFREILNHFKTFPSCPAASIHFEHPISGTQFSDQIYNAIVDYELHLRYFIQMQEYLNLPYAYQTIGSAMAVRASAYQKVEGMNKRKAGEDFYFIQKLIKLGGFTEINNTKVIPSPRISTRVPFGTGKAVQNIIEKGKPSRSYAIQSFLDLENLINHVPALYDMNTFELEEFITQLPVSLENYFNSINAMASIESIISNSSSTESFVKKFYQWFDAFKLMKYLHHARDLYYPDKELTEIFNWYFPEILNRIDPIDPKSRLKILREIDKLSRSELM